MNEFIKQTSPMNLIDCHCHILPDIDDGATDVKMMIEMAKVAVDTGTQQVFVTPHHGNGVFSNPRTQVLSALNECQNLLKKSNINLRLLPGSELHLTPELVSELENGSVLTYGDLGKAVLIELPKQHIPVGAEKILSQIIDLDITPIIAHPERNSDLLRTPALYEQWVQAGCKGQLTGMSVDGRFGKQIQKVCNRWIKGGHVHFIASDAHRPHGRSPDLSITYDFVSNHYGLDMAKCLMYNNPKNLVMGGDIKTCAIQQSNDAISEVPANGFFRKRLLNYFKK